MGKDYDRYVTPQNTPRFSERKILFLMAMGVLVLNVLLIALICPECWKGAAICAGWACAFAAIQCMDKRKEHWTWGYIIAWCVINALITAGFVLVAGLYWFFALLAVEVAALCFTAKRWCRMAPGVRIRAIECLLCARIVAKRKRLRYTFFEKIKSF